MENKQTYSVLALDSLCTDLSTTTATKWVARFSTLDAARRYAAAHATEYVYGLVVVAAK